MLLSAVDASELKVGPVDVAVIDGNGEGVDGGGDQNLPPVSINADALNDLPDGVGEVEHVLFKV